MKIPKVLMAAKSCQPIHIKNHQKCLERGKNPSSRAKVAGIGRNGLSVMTMLCETQREQNFE